MLRIMLALMMPLQAAAEGWPAFNLNHTRSARRIMPASDIWVPPVPEPIPVDLAPEDMTPYERMPVFSPYKHGSVFARGAVQVELRRERGEARLVFPDITFEEPAPGDRTELYIRVSTGTGAPAAFSWATAICFGAHYLGYKGASFTLPDASGNFSVRETFAMGLPKEAIAVSHPWLFDGGSGPEDLCSGKTAAALGAYGAARLPADADGAALKYDAVKNSLEVTWKR